MLLAALGRPAALPAQSGEECPAGVIAEISIANQSVFDLTRPRASDRYRWALELANRLHIRTRQEVIARELLLQVGDCYDVELLRDSERLLRAMTFLADAQVYGVQQPDGAMLVVVDTQDEWSTRVEPRISSGGFLGLRSLRLAEDNLGGTGRHLSVSFEQEHGATGYGFAYGTPQFLRTRWNLGLELSRSLGGRTYRAFTAYPFVGETGRVAFRQGVEREDQLFDLFMPGRAEDLPLVQVPLRREAFEIGGAFRWGDRVGYTLLGAALAGERVGYPEPPRLLDPDGRASTPLPGLGPWIPLTSARLMLLAGQQNIYYTRRRAVDTINGVEDMRLGVEAEAALGPYLPLVSGERDIALAFGLFAAGAVAPEILVGGRLTFEGRRNYRSLPGLPEWNDVLAEADGWAYLRSSATSSHTLVGVFSLVGGWHQRVPYQLTLGGDTGLRGYARHVDPGGRRIRGSIEHRAYLRWPLPDLFDLGTVVFVDAGKIWGGQAVFGTDSPVRASVGAGLRAAFPPGSGQTLRVDIGVPAQRPFEAGRVAISIGLGQAIGRHASRGDPQLARSGRYVLTTARFLDDRIRP